jgi:hypothetical protein
MNIADVRKQYPEYSDMSDGDLADSLHSKFYADMPKDQFYQKIGYQPPTLLQRANSADKSLDQNIVGFGKHALSDVADYGKDLLNLPHNVDKNIPAYLGLIPKFAQSDDNNQRALGINHNIGDTLATGYLKYSPFGTGGEKLAAKLLGNTGIVSRMLGNTAGSAAFGAAHNPDNKTMGGVEGGAIGGVAQAASEALPAIAKPAGDWLLSNALNPIARKVGEGIRDSVLPSMKDGVDHLSSMYNGLKQKASNLFTQAGQKAEKIPGDFDNSDYVADLKNHLGSLKQIASRGKASAAQVHNAMAQTQDWIENAPTSFKAATDHRQDINAAPDVYINPQNKEDAYVKRASDIARKSLDKQVFKNSQNNPQASDFYKTWKDANNHYSQAMSFEKIPNEKGVPSKIKGMGYGLSNESLDPSVLTQYLPKPKEEGTAKMDHLANLLGSNKLQNDPSGKEFAKQYLRSSFINKNTSNSGSVDIPKLLNNYGSLSDDQSKWLFDPYEKNLLDFASGQKTAEKGESKVAHGALHYGLPGLVGGIAAKEEGKPWWEGAGTGAGSALLLSKIAGAVAARHPQKFIQSAKALSSYRGNPSRTGKILSSVAQSGLNDSSNQQKPLDITIHKGFGG